MNSVTRRHFCHHGIFPNTNQRRNHIESHHHLQRSSSPTRHSTASMFKPTDTIEYQIFCMGLLSTRVTPNFRGTPKTNSLIGGNIVMKKNNPPAEDEWRIFADRMNKCIKEKQRDAKHVQTEVCNARCSSPLPNYSGAVFRKRGDTEYREFCMGIEK